LALSHQQPYVDPLLSISSRLEEKEEKFEHQKTPPRKGGVFDSRQCETYISLLSY